MKAMAKNTADRYRTMEEFAKELDAVLDTPSWAKPPFASSDISDSTKMEWSDGSSVIDPPSKATPPPTNSPKPSPKPSEPKRPPTSLPARLEPKPSPPPSVSTSHVVVAKPFRLAKVLVIMSLLLVISVPLSMKVLQSIGTADEKGDMRPTSSLKPSNDDSSPIATSSSIADPRGSDRGKHPDENVADARSVDVTPAKIVDSKPAPVKVDKPDAKKWTSPTTLMEFVLVRAGEFDMGSADDDKDTLVEEKPLHHVRISKPFYLGKFEVTRGQFRKFVEDTAYKTEAESDGKGGYGWNEAKKTWEQDPKYTWKSPGFDQTDDHPVIEVSWNDAVKLAEWLSIKDGRTYRIPSEAEWEYACRASSTTRYTFGDDEEELAKYGNVEDGTAIEKFASLPAIKAKDGYVFRRRWASFHQTHGASTTCTAMSGSGARIGTIRTTIKPLRATTLGARRVPRAG